MLPRKLSASWWDSFEFSHHRCRWQVAMGHIGMRYSLPSRVDASAAETVINAHWFDGVSIFPTVIKITPGMICFHADQCACRICSDGPMKERWHDRASKRHSQFVWSCRYLSKQVTMSMDDWISWKKMPVQLWLALALCLLSVHELFDGSIRSCSSWNMLS